MFLRGKELIMPQNPILTGFHPDPTICRVGDDYYLATSTFQWFPGVELYHSRDLVHWELLPSPLQRVSQLDMKGNPNSGGVWAPCLSYHEGVFYLIYTNVKNFHGIYKDTHNYLVTTTDPRGAWSEPVYLHSVGFDPSLFHDDDGKAWLVSMRWDARYGKHPFAGILIQEYSYTQKKLLGKPHILYEGTDIGVTEAPHLYKANGYYYLMVAEGGTSYNHGVRMARSKTLLGTYETDPQPVLTTRDAPEYPLQRAGHGCLVDTPDGDMYIAFLCARPLTVNKDRRSILGRETGIAPVVWDKDGWLRLKDGGTLPPLTYESTLTPWIPPQADDTFDTPTLPACYKTLRIPMTERLGSLTARAGCLRLYGREAITSWHEQSLVARRLQHIKAEVTVKMAFAPTSFQHMAGLVLMYDTYNFFYLHVTGNDEGGAELHLIYRQNMTFHHPLGGEGIEVDASQPIWLRVKVDHDRLLFSYATDGENYHPVGDWLDGSYLADEAYRLMEHEGHTGTMVGMACQDLSGGQDGEVCFADFYAMSYVSDL